MSTKSRMRTPLMPTIVTTAILLIGLELVILNVFAAGAIAIAVGAVGLGLSLLARRANSTTLERVITLSPRDERDAIKIQWGFALVGKITLVVMTLVGLATLAIFGATGMNFTECHQNGEAITCNVTEPVFIALGLSIMVAFFALVLVIAAVISAFKRN